MNGELSDNLGEKPGRVIVQSPMDGAFNMAADEVLLTKATQERQTILRLFQWNPWSLSLGKHQSTTGINLDRCQQKKIMVVRRLTGGRAVLHARELTYSICVPVLSDRPGFHHDVAIKVGKALCQGLQSLGADVEWVPKGRGVSRYRSSLCFASVARGEILWRGKKVVGSAQRVINGIVLQHGSILLDQGHEQIIDLWEDTSDVSPDILTSHTATLREILGKTPDDRLVMEEILQGFRSNFSRLDIEENLTYDEQTTIMEHANSYWLGGYEVGTMGVYSGADGRAA